MTIQLPGDLEASIRAAIARGEFASLDVAMAEAARLLLERGEAAPNADTTPDPLLGSMRDETQMIDEIVADTHRLRRNGDWRGTVP